MAREKTDERPVFEGETPHGAQWAALVRVADRAYPDGKVAEYYRDEVAQMKEHGESLGYDHGDTLALFIVKELSDAATERGLKDARAEAIRMMDAAARELLAVSAALARWQPPK